MKKVIRKPEKGTRPRRPSNEKGWPTTGSASLIVPTNIKKRTRK